MATEPALASVDDFLMVDIRVGTVVDALPFPEARKPACRMTIDFGQEIGLKTASAQVTDNYSLEELTGRQIAAVANFPRVRSARSCPGGGLTLGFPDTDDTVVLISPDWNVPNGGRLY